MEQATDRSTVRIVIGLIGALAVLLGAASVWLTATGTTVPDQLWTIETALVASLITLATTRSRPSDAPEVYEKTRADLMPHNGEAFGTPQGGPA